MSRWHIGLALALLCSGGVAACGAFSSSSGDAPSEPLGSASGDAEASADASPDAAHEGRLGGDPGVVCGTNTCRLDAEVCCADVNGCTALTAPCGRIVACDDGIDCPIGTVCCGQLGAYHLDFTSSECRTLHQCRLTGSAAGVLCNPDVPNPCPNGAQCTRVDGGRVARCTGLL